MSACTIEISVLAAVEIVEAIFGGIGDSNVGLLGTLFPRFRETLSFSEGITQVSSIFIFLSSAVSGVSRGWSP